MSFDLRRALRRIDPQRAGAARISEADHDYVVEPVEAGAQLLIDTCVYIDVLQGKIPRAVETLLEVRVINHSTVCLAELTHLFGRLDPADSRTKAVLKEIGGVVRDMPEHRLFAPSAQVYGEAGMLTGLVGRLRNAQEHRHRSELLNDATIFLQALEQGQTVLTRNIKDFSVFLSLAPMGRVMFYKV